MHERVRRQTKKAPHALNASTHPLGPSKPWPETACEDHPPPARRPETDVIGERMCLQDLAPLIKSPVTGAAGLGRSPSRSRGAKFSLKSTPSRSEGCPNVRTDGSPTTTQGPTRGSSPCENSGTLGPSYYVPVSQHDTAVPKRPPINPVKLLPGSQQLHTHIGQLWNITVVVSPGWVSITWSRNMGGGPGVLRPNARTV